jgi:hypothetical protein
MARLGTVNRVCRQIFVCAALTCGMLGASGLAQLAGNSSPNNSEAKTQMQRHHPVIVSEFSSHDTQPDGDLDKPFWSAARRVSFDQAGFTRTQYPYVETRVASRWTRHYLYLAFWARYQSLNVYQGEDPRPERLGLWDKDVVESFIAPDSARPDHYYEFEVAPNNQWVDLEIDLTKHPFGNAQWNSGFEHATRVDAAQHLWTSEWRIPLASLSPSGITSGGAWRINFYRCDGEDPNRRLMSWGPLPRELPQSSFHQPESFGVLRFASPHDSEKAH